MNLFTHITYVRRFFVGMIPHKITLQIEVNAITFLLFTLDLYIDVDAELLC